MSAGRAASRFADDESINDLILKLQELLPDSNQIRRSPTGGWRILKETCSYIKKLQREVEELSERLSHLLNSLDDDVNSTTTVTVEDDQLRTTLLSLLHHQEQQHQQQQ